MNEIEFRTASTQMQLASQLEQAGNTEQAKVQYAEAGKLFAKTAQVPGFELAANAIFQRAFIENRLGNLEQAATLYAQVADTEQPLAVKAAVYAGRDFLAANKPQQAEKWLTRAIEQDSPQVAEAAHWLAQLYLKAKQPEQAYRVANQWVRNLADQPGHSFLPALMLDRADAVFMDTDTKSDSVELYQQIVERYPQHQLAPTALYNAAFAQLDAKDYQAAVKTSLQFEEQYAENDYLVDTLEVKADAYLMLDDSANAEAAFKQLRNRFPENTKSNVWALRAAFASYQQKKYAETVSWLEPLLEDMNRKEQAEALHWIGVSLIQNEDDKLGGEILAKSLELDPEFSRRDETLLALSQAQLRTGDQAGADRTLAMMKEVAPDSPLAAEAGYRIAESLYQQEQFEKASRQFDLVAANHPKSEFVPFALYNAGWSQLKLGATLTGEQAELAAARYQAAVQRFTRLIELFPEHELATSALIGRGASLRKMGESKRAILDLKQFIATGPDEKMKVDGLYELGLAQVESRDWESARTTFETLIADAPDSPLADRFHYELAWACYSTSDKEKALEEFKLIADRYPESALAAEANFHLGNAAYDAAEYEAAIAAYQKCMDDERAKLDLREKSAHKLAWSHYKLEDYEASETAFLKQIDGFPEGPLLADAKVMRSESLLQQKKYEEAYAAYRVAKPAIDQSQNADPNFRWVTYLHGGQSAVKSKKYQEAIEFVQPILDSESASTSLKQDAQLEMGYAYQGLGQTAEALLAWEEAAQHPGKTGARAQCMIGDVLFGQRKFADAVKQFKLVMYGFGGTQAPADVQPWQAYATYEAARCHFVQVSSAEDPQEKSRLIDEATKLFTYLVENYPNDRIAPQARKQLEQLQMLKRQ